MRLLLRYRLTCVLAVDAALLAHGWITSQNDGNPSRLPLAPIDVPMTAEKGAPVSVDNDGEVISAWQVLAGNIVNCLIRSDLKRDSGFDGSSTGWTSWVEESSAFRLQQCMNKLVLAGDVPKFDLTAEQDDLVRWLKWMKSSPAPMIVEFSDSLRNIVNSVVTEKELHQVEQAPEEFLSRISMRLILLPSGKSLQSNIRTAPGAMVYGKQLYGGSTRYRVIGSSNRKRKAGERTVIASKGEPIDAWLQYGGPERNYDALDMGPCALMELTILPKGLHVPELNENNGEMHILKSPCDPDVLFDFAADNPANKTGYDEEKDLELEANISEFGHPHMVASRFTKVLGGLNEEIDSIVRRVLDGRAIVQNAVPVYERASEMKMMLDLGLHPIKGLLLYGPPGCGKTALAREISRLLTECPPKIVSAPELLDRWVGGSEKLVRDLFGDAEAELRMCNGDLTKSGLHVVVIDEIDAVFRKRSSAPDSGEVARASAVNQILAKMDGVNALGNILLIATTNRPELLDDALVRPGRLEVQVEVPLPDREGRREILQIHFDALRSSGRLSKPLCEAIDGLNHEVNEKRRWRKMLRGKFTRRMIRDLADDRWTKGFSGADLEGLVRCAGSMALSRTRRDGSGFDGLLITLEDVRQALDEVGR